MLEWLILFIQLLRGQFISRQALIFENTALRSQLALFDHQIASGKRKRPKTTRAFRQIWVILSKIFAHWKSAMVVVKPETVIKWHRTAFRLYWKCKSKPKGRPSVSPATIALIKRIHNENRLWSPERIHDQLISLGITDVPCPNTIAKYIPETRKPPSDKACQSWKTFLANHMHNTYAIDFFTVPTLVFRILYVFVIISHERREIKHIAVTAHPTATWTIQQLREATPFGEQPKYLIHDNDPVFRSEDVQLFLIASNIESVRTGYRRPDQNGICERLVGILRRELLDHMIPLNEQHLHKLLREYVDKYYHLVRTHSSLEHKPPFFEENVEKLQTLSATELQPEPILGGLYMNYQAKAA